MRKLDDGDNENDIRWRDGRVICSRCSRTNEISLSTMSQSVTSTKPNPFGPAVSECSLRSLKETDGSEPIICQLSARQIPSPHCFLSLFRCPSFLDSKFEQAVSEVNIVNLSNKFFYFFVVRGRRAAYVICHLAA